jgi:hypothetical protein
MGRASVDEDIGLLLLKTWERDEKNCCDLNRMLAGAGEGYKGSGREVTVLSTEYPVLSERARYGPAYSVLSTRY